MGWLRVLHLTCVFTYGGLGAYVLWRAPGLRRSIGFGILTACFAWWSASLVIAHDASISEAVARSAYDVGAVAWAAFAPCCLLFALAFTGQRVPRRRMLVIAAPALGFAVLQWRGVLAGGYTRETWGWAYEWSSSPWTFAYYAYYQVLVAAALFVVWRYRRSTSDRVERRQASLIVGTAFVPLVLASLTDVILPRLGSHVIPNIAPAFLLAWVAGIAVAVVRHRLLELSPETAAGAIVASMADGVLLVDPAGIVVRCNAAAASLFGTTAERIAGTPFAPLVADVANGLLTRDDRVLSLANSPVTHHDGTTLGALWLVRDVTARERVAQALREAHDDMDRRVRERTKELDDANTHLRRLSRALEAMLAAVDAIHKAGTVAEAATAIANAVPRGVAAGALTGCSLAIDDGRYTSTGFAASEHVVKVEIRGGDVRRGEIEVHLVPEVTLDDEATRMLEAIALELGQSLDALALRQALARSERLASMGLLAAGVAHEINNPLAYAIASLDEIAAQADAEVIDRAVVKERSREALDGARRIASIVRELGAFARPRDDHQIIDIAAPIDAAIALARNQLRHRAKLVVEHEAAASVRADPGRLTQVVLNLILNAVHAIPETGGKITIRSWADAGAVYIRVTDNGVGIPAEDLPRLFEPFFTRKLIGQGSGLGLSVSHGIVTSAGGQIDATSEVGVGSSFTVVLPRAPDEPRPSVAVSPSREASAAAAGPARILIIDDDPLVGTSMRRLLRAYECKVVESVEAAKRELSAATFDVVISDIMMPDATAEVLVAWIEAESPVHADRLLLMTGGAFTEVTEALVARMHKRMIAKPFEVPEVRRLVAEVLAQHRPSS